MPSQIPSQPISHSMILRTASVFVLPVLILAICVWLLVHALLPVEAGSAPVAGVEQPVLQTTPTHLAASITYTPTFTPHYFGGANSTLAIAVGDMNGDGTLDVIQGNYTQQSAVYLNDGHGGFGGAGEPFGAANITRAIAVADIDDDGALDIIQGNDGQMSMVYLNDGRGGFGAGVSFGSAYATYAIAVGDINGDGALDIIQGNGGADDIQQSVVYLNDGHGGFGAGVSFGSANHTFAIAVGDVNSDGALDIVQGNWWTSGPSMVYLNDGHGGFGVGVQFGSANTTLAIAVGDINGDGALDIIQGSGFPASTVYLNDGRGGFGAGVSFGSAYDTRSLAVGDVNGDGALDIIQGNASPQSVVYLNDGHGGFSAGTPFGGVNTAAIAVGDVNGDGALDIVQGNVNQESAVCLNDQYGGFGVNISLPRTVYSANGTRSIVVGDLNGDGFMDIVQGSGDDPFNLNSWPLPSVAFQNNGDGSFSGGVPFGSEHWTKSIALGDINGDNTLDIIQGNDLQQSMVYLNDGHGGFGGVPFGNASNTHGVAVGDMNGDGALDIIQGNYAQRSMLYLNNKHGGFDTEIPFGNVNTTNSIVVGDVNGDGALDIIQGNENEPGTVYLNDGHGGFRMGVQFGSVNHTSAIAVGDINGDGALDIIQGNGGKNYTLRSIVYINNGRGGFGAGTSFGSFNNTFAIAVGDVNGDGALDIIQGNGGTRAQQSIVYLNDGQGGFSVGVPYGGGSSAVAVGDMNHDSMLDIIQGNYYEPIIVSNNTRLSGLGLPNDPLKMELFRPGVTDNANFFSASDILSSTIIPITYTLSDPEGDPVRLIRASYSPDGGGKWYTSTAVSGTPTMALSTRRYWNVTYLTPTVALPVNEVVTSTLALTATSPLTATDVKIWVAISHTQASDLRLVLQSPTGVTVTLLNTGTLQGEISQTILFDAAASTSILAATAPYGGAYQPADKLMRFDGLDAYGTWQLRVENTTPDITGTLHAWGLRVQDSAGVHVYNWDTFASGFFGQSDNVVFRIEAYPSLSSGPNGVPVFQHPYASATTFPFRVRGTQVRVLSDTVPISNALVYRLPAGQSGGGQLMTDGAGQPFHTDPQGYLQGRGQINLNDQLLALVPITSHLTYAGALTFDSIDDYVIANPFNAAPITETTVSFWLRSADTTGHGTPFSYASSSHADEFLITDDTNLTLAHDSISVTTGISLTDDVWHHLAVTWRALDGQVQVYKDGVAAYTGTLSATPIITGGSLILGQSQGSVDDGFDASRAFSGSLGGVRVWTVVLTPTQIQQDMLGKPTGSAANRVLDWSFDAPVNDAVSNHSGHGNDGTVFGATWDGRSLGGYTVYHTNGVPTVTGLGAFTVTQPGVQTLVVTATHPLILFDLDVSLEWDAHTQPIYLQQLESDLKKASAYLYDFTNGQVALSKVTVHQNSDDWLTSQVVVYATNHLRPLAVQGGVVTLPITDPLQPNIVYYPGQVRMGAVWNRYGEPGADVSDWSLALAHELSHYLLYQEDAYLGLNQNGLLVPLGDCTGSAMGDMYNPDNTEFIYDQVHWNAACANTLANLTLHRTEWATNHVWYPWLVTPTMTNTGPSLMPFDLTTVTIDDPISPTNALADPTFFVRYQDGVVASSNARGFFTRTVTSGEDYVVALGNPLGGQNRLTARGVQPGDRLCVFDQVRHQYGCQIMALGDTELRLKQDATWTPLIQFTPVNSLTLNMEVNGLTTTLPFSLNARLYPESGVGGDVITLTQIGGVYTGTFSMAYPVMLGYVQLWVDEPATDLNPRRETIVAYSMSGNPGQWPGFQGSWLGFQGSWPGFQGSWPGFQGSWPGFQGSWPSVRGSFAPLTSPDGQMLFFTSQATTIPEGNLYTVQSVAGLPPLPTNKRAIGQGYSLVASPNVTRVITGSISFQYLSLDVLVEEADEDQLTIHYWDGQAWEALPTERSSYYNMASAPSHGPGLYALLAGVTTPRLRAISPTLTTNDLTTTLTISGTDFLPPVDVLLIGPAVTYTLPVSSVSPITITAVVSANLPAHEYQVRVRNRYDDALSPTSVSFASFDRRDACFYDLFESSSIKWQRSGTWDIVMLPDGNQAITDSPDGSYGVTVSPTMTATTSITSSPFNLSDCPNPILTFRHDYVIDNRPPSHDWGHVEISTDDGATWRELARYTGGIPIGLSTLTANSEWADADWKNVTIDLSAYTGTVRLRFGLEIDRYGSERGWVIDDVLVRSAKDHHIFLPIVLRK